MDDPLKALMEWYAAQCDGSWEHDYGIKIDTLDNPGWYLEIDLTDTPLQDVPFEKSKTNTTTTFHGDAAGASKTLSTPRAARRACRR